MNAREILADALGWSEGMGDYAIAQADELLDALQSAGFQVVKLEQAGARWIETEELSFVYVSSGPRWHYDQGLVDGNTAKYTVQPLYRIIEESS